MDQPKKPSAKAVMSCLMDFPQVCLCPTVEWTQNCLFFFFSSETKVDWRNSWLKGLATSPVVFFVQQGHRVGDYNSGVIVHGRHNYGQLKETVSQWDISWESDVNQGAACSYAQWRPRIKRKKSTVNRAEPRDVIFSRDPSSLWSQSHRITKTGKDH